MLINEVSLLVVMADIVCSQHYSSLVSHPGSMFGRPCRHFLTKWRLGNVVYWKDNGKGKLMWKILLSPSPGLPAFFLKLP